MTRFAVFASVALAAGMVSAAPAPGLREAHNFQVGQFDWNNWESISSWLSWHTKTRTPTVAPTPTLTSVMEATSTSSVTAEPTSAAPEPTTATSEPTSAAPEPTSSEVETSSAPPATSTEVPTTSAAPATTAAPTTTPKPVTTSKFSTTSKAATTSAASSGNADIDAYLKGHNDIRAQHGASALTWADDLAAAASKWAGNCVWEHSQGKVGSFGENLAAGTGLTAAAAVKMWTDEASEYNPANPQYSHFTQVVWKATTEVGCAVTSCTGLLSGYSGAVNYHVCEYRAPGNVIGQFAQNVQA